MSSPANSLNRHRLPGCRGSSRLVLLAFAAIFTLLKEHSVQAGYAAYVVDANSGAVLHKRNSEDLNYPASLCKVMTLYLIFKGLDHRDFFLDSMVPISARAARQPASKLGLNSGQSITLREAILALTTKSANDIATALAEFASGSESTFAEQMTREAQALGMSKTVFRNASGLPNSRQKTTARDLSILALAMYAHFPHYTHYFSRKNFSYRGRTYRNHNNLLGTYEGVQGIKTGYTRAAGYNLMVSAKQDGHHIIAVVLGGKTSARRDAQMRRLLDQAYERFERNDKLFALIAPPPIKPMRGTATTKAPLKKSSLKNLAHAADIAGEALTQYVAVPEASATPIRDKTWGIQLGAFSRHEAATRVLDSVVQQFPKMLGNTRREVSPIADSIGTLYRARHIGLTEATARALCAELTARAQACIIAPPPPPS